MTARDGSGRGSVSAESRTDQPGAENADDRKQLGRSMDHRRPLPWGAVIACTGTLPVVRPTLGLSQRDDRSASPTRGRAQCYDYMLNPSRLAFNDRLVHGGRQRRKVHHFALR